MMGNVVLRACIWGNIIHISILNMSLVSKLDSKYYIWKYEKKFHHISPNIVFYPLCCVPQTAVEYLSRTDNKWWFPVDRGRGFLSAFVTCHIEVKAGWTVYMCHVQPSNWPCLYVKFASTQHVNHMYKCRWEFRQKWPLLLKLKLPFGILKQVIRSRTWIIVNP